MLVVFVDRLGGALKAVGGSFWVNFADARQS
jgi:hypothetical protein